MYVLKCKTYDLRRQYTDQASTDSHGSVNQVKRWTKILADDLLLTVIYIFWSPVSLVVLSPVGYYEINLLSSGVKNVSKLQIRQNNIFDR